jgi:imidazolonepropionase-like amidohydrolase
MRPLFLGLCLFGLLLHSRTPVQRHSALVLTNANVMDVRSGRIVPGMTVLIEDGKITHIAKLALVPQSRNLTVVNASGKFLIPGLWDMHVHSAFAEALTKKSSIRFISQMA